MRKVIFSNSLLSSIDFQATDSSRMERVQPVYPEIVDNRKEFRFPVIKQYTQPIEIDFQKRSISQIDVISLPKLDGRKQIKDYSKYQELKKKLNLRFQFKSVHRLKQMLK